MRGFRIFSPAGLEARRETQCSGGHGVWISLAVAALLLACGGGATGPVAPPPPPPPPPQPPTPGGTGPVTGTITADGGTISATTDNGAVVTLTVPGGAVAEPIEVTLRPLTPESGLWMSIALEPAGLVFGKAFEVSVRLPASVPLTDPQLLLGSLAAPIYVPTTVDLPARTLKSQFWFFGVTPAGPAVSAMGRAVGPTWDRPMAANGGGTNTLGAASVPCQQVIANVQQSFNAFLATGAYRLAIDAALAIAGQLAGSSCPGAEDWVAQAQQIACDRYGVALQAASGSPITTFRQFKDQTQPIIEWTAVAQGLTADCVADGGYSAAVTDRIEAFLTFMTGRLSTLSANDHETFNNLKEEALTASELTGIAETLGLSSLAELVDRQAFRGAVDRMRQNAYAQCRYDGWHYALSRLTPTGFFAARDIIGVDPPRGLTGPPPTAAFNFSEDDIFEDLQYCGTDVEFQAVVTSGGQSAQKAAGTQGTPGNKVGQVSIEMPTRGKIRFAGELLAFTCWNQIEADNEVTFALEGRDVLALRRSGKDYFGQPPIEVDIAQAAKDAGITPKEGTTHELVVRRKRTRCDERLWGPEEFELLKATLVWKNPKLEVGIGIPADVAPGARVPLDIRVDVVDLLGQPSVFEDIDVTLDVTGGTPELAGGVTDAAGYFRTFIVVDDAPDPAPGMAPAGSTAGLRAPSGPAAVQAPADVSIKATAKSSEGAVGEALMRTCTGNCACQQPREEWEQPELVDDSYISGGTASAVASLNGPHLDYLAVSGGGMTSGTTSSYPEWSPSVSISGRAYDYLWIEPLVPIEGKYLWAKVHGVGFAEAETIGGNCCGRYGDARAEIVLSGTLFWDGSTGGVNAAAGADYSGERPPSARREVDQVLRIRVPTGQWWKTQLGISGNLRHRGAGATARVNGRLSLEVLDVVDANDVSVPVVICSAAGVDYGAGASLIAGTGVVASRPTLQAGMAAPVRR